MHADEAGIIGGGSPAAPERPPLLRFVLEETAWLLAALAATVFAAQILVALGGRWAAWAPGMALFGLHGLVGLHVARSNGAQFAAWLRVRWRDVLWGLAGGAVLLGFNGAYGWLLERAGIEAPDVAAMLRDLLPAPALYLWAAGLVPVVEELYFRGRLLDEFGARLGPTWAALITSAAFAAIHGIPAFVPAFLVFAGVLLALRRRTGGLLAPIVAHMINNAFVLM
jgi:membrane protease YdiL (CAAX protease family)